MRNLMTAVSAAAIISALAGCATMPAEEPAPEIGTWGLDLAAMNAEIDPGDDFFRWVNGTWLDTFEMPADRSTYGIFTALRERSEEQVRAIVEGLAEEEPAPGSIEQKVGAFFASWMDADGIEAGGMDALAERLAEFAEIDTRDEVMAAFVDFDNQAPFGVGILPDPADTTRYTVFVGQGGLGLPDRDYYLLDDERFVEFRSAYRDYIIEVHELAGLPDGEARADEIIALETRLAESHWTNERSRQIQEIYNPMPAEGLAGLSPELDWPTMLGALGLSDVDTLIVGQTTAVEAAGDIFADTSVDTWRHYLTFHYVSDHAPYISAALDEARFDFFGRTLRGQEEQRERWERGIGLVNDAMGEAVGQAYVDRHFPPSHLAAMQELVGNLQVAFEERLETLDWMDDETREAALLKLSTFEPRVGYPAEWIDYSNLEIVDGDALGNAERASEFAWNLELERLGGPVDRSLWAMTPQTVNAYYNPLLNQITFPAAILQPPFFDPAADAAVNYGAIGAVIGHEIGHGFDDQGRRFDETGLIRDWWTPVAEERFRVRSDELVAQYDAFSPIEGMNVNGRLTLGENIGDLGGLQMAYSAYQRHIAEHGEPEVIDGYTGDQRFFMAWAQVWRGMRREDSLREQLLTDPHSPYQYRVNGVVRNMDAWYEAFNVTEDDALYLPPERRVHIW